MAERQRCLSNLRSVQIHLAIRRRSLGSNRGMQGASELKTWLTSGRLSESFCNVVDGKEEMSSEHNCGFGFLNSQTLRQNRAVENQKCRTQMTRTTDSIYHDAREVWSWSARLKGQRPLCVGRCIRDTSSKATERLFVAVCPRSFVLILCFLLPVSGCGVFLHCFPCSVFPR